MRNPILFLLLTIILASTALAQPARAERRLGIRPAGQAMPAGAVGGMVNLPYIVNDNAGNQWMIYQGGWMRQQGNAPMYSQAAMIQINNQGVGHNTNQARVDEKTGELIFENMTSGPVRITRRVLVNADEGYIRYIDILKNTQAAEQSVNVAYQSNFNYQVMNSQMVNDPRAKDRALACVAQMNMGGPVGRSTAWEMYGGRGAKNVVQIQPQFENNWVRASAQLTIPGNGEMAIMHLHGTANTPDAAVEFVNGLRESKLLADVAPALRKLIFNFGSPNNYIEDREVLRGDVFDVIELRGGDLVKGTLNEPAYKLETFYGVIELPAERVIGLINVGQFRPRQLVVTVDGEVFGGKLAGETIEMQLSSGQVTQVPLSQIARVGYRKRAGEPEEWSFEKPFVMLRSGERIGIEMPPGTIDVLTRYGLLKLRPETIGAIAFQTEEHGVHEIYLTDGSAFAGLVTAPQFDVKLTGSTSGDQPITIPAAAMARLQLTTKVAEIDENETPNLTLANEDTLVGAIAGELKLDTTFDTIAIDGAEVRAMQRVPDGGLDVQITLWDQTIVSGQLQSPQVTCTLNSGIDVSVPLSLIEKYSNPRPRPSPVMVERIKSVVAELNADDWKQRERAEAQLVAMGPAVVGVLRELAPSQPPEAQQRIDSILKQLDKATGPTAASVQPVQINE